MTGPGCGWSKISRVRAPYDNLDPAVKPLQSPESAVYIMDSLLGLGEHECGPVLRGLTEAWCSLSTLSKQVHPSIMRTIRAAVHRLPGFQDIDTGNAIR